MQAPRSSRACPTALRLVVFDLDGTLVDSSTAIVDDLLAQAAAEGLPVPTRAWAGARIGFPPEETWALLGAPDPRATLERFRARCLPTLPERTRVMAGAGEALATLRADGLALAVATSRRTASAVDTLATLGLSDAFVCIAGLDLVQRPKPAPDLLQAVLQRTGHAPAQALMVGDTAADVAAARAAEIACWAVLGGHGDESSLRAAGCDRILSDGLGELAAALREIQGTASPSG